jgi:secreted trypsin-like serine protease
MTATPKLAKLAAVLVAWSMLTPTQAFAIDGGKEVPGHSRIVSLYFQPENETFKYDGCSAFLYAPRIVITAAHCLFKPRGSQERIKDVLIFVGKPGAVLQANGMHAQARKVFMPDSYKNERFGALYNNEDFAIIVTKQRVAKVSRATPISEKEFKELHANLGKVLIGGYGFSSEEERYQKRNGLKYPRLIELELAPIEYVQGFGVADPIEKYGWAMTNSEVGSTCDGDSGAGFYIEKGKKAVYVGLNAWPIGSPNCWNNQGWRGSGGLNRIDPIYNRTDLLNQALAYEAKLRTIK